MGEVTPFYRDDWLTVFHGDCREVMASMPAESVHCVVTSPPLEPYWGLRDYGSPGQLGLEPTPEEYVANLVAVFREVRRVLRHDGTVWLNLGDSYAAGKTGRDDNDAETRTRFDAHGHGGGVKFQAKGNTGKARKPPDGLKAKDLVGIPWMVAFALRADGWFLRSDIVWSKSNPMPESVTDRPTKSHEYIFLLSRSPRYYFDADAVREPHVREWDATNGGSISTGRMVAAGGAMGDMSSHPKGYPLPNPAGRNIRSVWTIATEPYPGAHFATFPEKLIEPMILAGCPSGGVVLDPFAGSGTTGMVSQRLGRRAVLIDLSLDYLGQLMARNADIPLGLTS